MNILDLDDDGELNNKYRHKKWNAKKYGVLCLLSFEEYCSLLVLASIKSSDIGPMRYHLSRHGDKGNYEIGNCVTKKKIGEANSVSQAAERNSQYGTCWITRDGTNKRIKKEDKESYLSNGWSSGRVGNFAPRNPRNQYAAIV